MAGLVVDNPLPVDIPLVGPRRVTDIVREGLLGPGVVGHAVGEDVLGDGELPDTLGVFFDVALLDCRNHRAPLRSEISDQGCGVLYPARRNMQ